MKTIGALVEVLRQKGLLGEVWIGGKRLEAGEDGKAPLSGALRWLTCDSRSVVAGTVFICKGQAFRAEYLQEAVRRGAICYISENRFADAAAGSEGAPVTALIVTDIRRAMAASSAFFFGYRPGAPILTGITGTKGKTTTAWYLKAMLDGWEQSLGQPETGLVSTVENYDGTSRYEAVMTTPEAPTLHELIANADRCGVRYMTMEVSSQALKYKRVRELQFEVGVFLNISEDHISPKEHVDFEDYFSAKLSMFRQVRTACVNLDSDYAGRIVKAARKAERIVTFGRHPEADLRVSRVRIEGGQVSFCVTCDRFSEQFTLGMQGSFNIENAAAAIAAGYVYGVPVEYMQRALRETRVPGRMETFCSADGKLCGIVDFAHNRLSFEKLFDAAFQEYAPYRRILTVFGCPGGKALNRRRELGIIAGLFSDGVVITSDDPGTECPEKIQQEIRSYVEMTGCTCRSVTDRRAAVDTAISLAAAGEERTLILLLGRGSEKYQQIGGRAIAAPMDAQLMREAIAEYDRRTANARCGRAESVLAQCGV